MPTYSRRVNIPGKSSQELYDVVSNGIDRFMSKASIGSYTVDRDPAHKQVHVKGSMFSATLKCEDAFMELNAKLSLIAAPFKSKLDEGITRWLAKSFDSVNSA